MDYHPPALINEVIDQLNILPGKVYIDCTLGNGGHTQAILAKGGIVYAFEQDPQNIEIVKKRISSPNLHIINDNFVNLNKHINFKVDGILFDLGLSANQQKSDNRGFSFNDALSLDMRLNSNTQDLTAKQIVNTYSPEELFNIFSKNAQEKNSNQIVKLITKNRPFHNALQLAQLIRNTYPRTSKIDPATKVFLALRIAVNNEFENLKTALVSTLSLLKPSGIVCVISFHSGEDRIVKIFIKNHHFTSTLLQPTNEEIKKNPLSRSAVLRSYKID